MFDFMRRGFRAFGELPTAPLAVRRFAHNPVIRPEMLPVGDGANINGPSRIRVPDWVPDRLGVHRRTEQLIARLEAGGIAPALDLGDALRAAATHPFGPNDHSRNWR